MMNKVDSLEIQMASDVVAGDVKVFNVFHMSPIAGRTSLKPFT